MQLFDSSLTRLRPWFRDYEWSAFLDRNLAVGSRADPSLHNLSVGNAWIIEGLDCDLLLTVCIRFTTAIVSRLMLERIYGVCRLKRHLVRKLAQHVVSIVFLITIAPLMV